jgi:2-oxoglutaroyl-CoA hydrolase
LSFRKGVADDQLEATVDALVDELRDLSPIAQRTAKKLLNDTEDSSLSIAIELEGHCYSRRRQSDDFHEGVEAFHAKRQPQFRGTDRPGGTFANQQSTPRVCCPRRPT